MKRSTDRILVSHAGVLPRPNDLRDMMGPGHEAEFHKRLPSAVKEIVDQQVKTGFDVSTTASSARSAASRATRERASAASRCVTCKPG